MVLDRGLRRDEIWDGTRGQGQKSYEGGHDNGFKLRVHGFQLHMHGIQLHMHGFQLHVHGFQLHLHGFQVHLHGLQLHMHVFQLRMHGSPLQTRIPGHARHAPVTPSTVRGMVK